MYGGMHVLLCKGVVLTNMQREKLLCSVWGVEHGPRKPYAFQHNAGQGFLTLAEVRTTEVSLSNV